MVRYVKSISMFQCNEDRGPFIMVKNEKYFRGPCGYRVGIKCTNTMPKQTTVTMFYMCCFVFAHAKS